MKIGGKNMKKVLVLILSLAMAMTMLTGCGGSAPEEPPAAPEAADDLASLDPVTIVFATPNGATNIESVYAQKWIEAVKEASNGQITFDYTNSGALGAYAELLEGVNYGVYDMTITDPGNILEYVPESAIMSLPMMLGSYDDAVALWDGEVGKWYMDLVAEKTDLLPLNSFFCGFRYICSKEPITTLADCKGVLIRSPQSDIYTDLLGLMDFAYVVMSWPETYTAMSTGVVDTVEVPLQNIYEAGFYDLGKYVNNTRHIMAVNCITVNQQFWDELPDAYKEILTSTLEPITAEERTQCEADEKDYVAKLEAEGVTFTDFDDASMAEIRNRFTGYWQEKVNPIGGDAPAMLEKAIAATE
jgi:TRAP-type C4-dicarboxylate transport system substrate-binding protein